MDLYQEQIELEKAITMDGALKYKQHIQEAQDKNLIAETSVFVKIISSYIEDIVGGLNDYKQQYQAGMVVRRSTAAIILDQLDLRKAAYIALKTTINCCTKQTDLISTAMEIAKALEVEERFSKFRAHNKYYYDRAISELNERCASAVWKIGALDHTFNDYLQFHTDQWPRNQAAAVGHLFIELIMDLTPLVEETVIWKKNNKQKRILSLSSEVLEYFEQENDKLELLCPNFQPMIVPPRDWTSIFEGGYLSPFIVQNKIIRKWDKKYLQKLNTATMPAVYSAINFIQSVPWKINPNILTTLFTLWEDDRQIAGLPAREDFLPPPFPYPDTTKDTRNEEQKEAVAKWNKEAQQTYKSNIKLRSARLLTAQIIKLAQKYSKYERIYFPWNMDFRGRLYPIPVTLNPQGCDMTKSLLLFAEGKALVTEEAVNALRIYGANCWGNDKISLEDRVQFIKDKEKEILAYVEDSTNNTGWIEADKPWCFLAFCYDYAGYLRHGYGYTSYLPVYTDGTCNGIQHYSALLRDEVAGKAVNLINSDKPSDVYQIVADKLKILLSQEKDLLAEKWLSLDFNRKLTKKIVMTLPYGLSKVGSREYIEAYLLENYSTQFLFNHFQISDNHKDCIFKATNYLNKLLWQAIENTLSSTIKGMQYLREVSQQINETGQPLEWLTPCGLLVNQLYKNIDIHTVKTLIHGSIRCLNYAVEIDKLNKLKQQNGICPNFIHSLDAAMLMKWLNKCKENHIYSVSSIHDSYGVLANDVAESSKLLRQCFVEIYTRDVLFDFVNDICSLCVNPLKLPVQPVRGTLDIQDVLDSTYFFN